MKTLTYTEARRLLNSRRAFPQSAKLSIGSWRRYIENTDWDERIIGSERRLDKLCWGIVILSSLIFLPFLVAALLK